tara:strand:+ start:249 stop:428 length:180 start_codon:yes stop_codon:yes gene_type:complete
MTLEQLLKNLLSNLHDLQDDAICPRDVLDDLGDDLDFYVDIEVEKRLDEIDDTFKNIEL